MRINEINEAPQSRARQQFLKNKQKRNFQQGAVQSMGRIAQMARQKSATRDYQSSEIKLPDGRMFSNSAQGWIEVDPKTKKPAQGAVPLSPTSAQAKQLDKYYANKGQEPKGFMSKMKDKFNQAIGGELATKTKADPNANVWKRTGATAGAGIGRAMGNLLRSKPQIDQPTDKKAVSNVAKTDLGYLQKAVMGGDEQAAQKFVDELSRMKSQNVDISNYAATLPAMLKRTKMDKQSPAYQQLVKVARSMSRESFEHVNKVLEYAGITWEQLGYKVLITESQSDVVLIPQKDLELFEYKVLAGV